MIENKRILIVDDEPYNILGLKIVLQQSGIKNILSIVDSAHNGKKANEMVMQAFERQTYSYGLIFMDCSMPVMSGYDASDLIRKFLNEKCMPQPMIIATTGHTEDEYINKCWVHQIDEVIRKYTNKEILEWMKQH
jgi:CheY-like chemotaxis protein